MPALGTIAGGGPGRPFGSTPSLNTIAGGGVPYPAMRSSHHSSHHRHWYDDCFHPHWGSGWNVNYHHGDWSFSFCDWWPSTPRYYHPVYVEVPVVYTEYVYTPVYVTAEPLLVYDAYDEIDRLISNLKYGDVYGRKIAARELGYEYSYRALEPLTYSLLTDPEPSVRYQSAKSLGRLGYREALPALRRAADSDPDDSVRDEAEDSIARIIRG